MCILLYLTLNVLNFHKNIMCKGLNSSLGVNFEHQSRNLWKNLIFLTHIGSKWVINGLNPKMFCVGNNIRKSMTLFQIQDRLFLDNKSTLVRQCSSFIYCIKLYNFGYGTTKHSSFIYVSASNTFMLQKLDTVNFITTIESLLLMYIDW